MAKTMCASGGKKRRKRRLEESIYACKKCGERVAKKKYVCKPVKLKDAVKR